MKPAMKRVLQHLENGAFCVPSRRYTHWYISQGGVVLGRCTARTIRALKEGGFIVLTGSELNAVSVTQAGHEAVTKCEC